MDKPKMLRKRYIPNEIVDISRDEILFIDENLIVTKWKTIKPRNDFSHGVSFTFINIGIKISKFFDKSGTFLYWYCDIINIEYDYKNNTYILTDLLVDVKVLPDGLVNILDCDELAEAFEKNIISKEETCSALKKLHELLNMINKNEFPPKICLDKLYI